MDSAPWIMAAPGGPIEASSGPPSLAAAAAAVAALKAASAAASAAAAPSGCSSTAPPSPSHSPAPSVMPPAWCGPSAQQAAETQGPLTTPRARLPLRTVAIAPATAPQSSATPASSWYGSNASAYGVSFRNTSEDSENSGSLPPPVAVATIVEATSEGLAATAPAAEPAAVGEIGETASRYQSSAIASVAGTVASASSRATSPTTGDRGRGCSRSSATKVFDALYTDAELRSERLRKRQTEKEEKEAKEFEQQQREYMQRLRAQQKSYQLHYGNQPSEGPDAHLVREADFLQKREQRRQRRAEWKQRKDDFAEMAECTFAPASYTSPERRAYQEARQEQLEAERRILEEPPHTPARIKRSGGSITAATQGQALGGRRRRYTPTSRERPQSGKAGSSASAPAGHSGCTAASAGADGVSATHAAACAVAAAAAEGGSGVAAPLLSAHAANGSFLPPSPRRPPGVASVEAPDAGVIGSSSAPPAWAAVMAAAALPGSEAPSPAGAPSSMISPRPPTPNASFVWSNTQPFACGPPSQQQCIPNFADASVVAPAQRLPSPTAVLPPRSWQASPRSSPPPTVVPPSAGASIAATPAGASVSTTAATMPPTPGVPSVGVATPTLYRPASPAARSAAAVVAATAAASATTGPMSRQGQGSTASPSGASLSRTVGPSNNGGQASPAPPLSRTFPAHVPLDAGLAGSIASATTAGPGTGANSVGFGGAACPCPAAAASGCSASAVAANAGGAAPAVAVSAEVARASQSAWDVARELWGPAPEPAGPSISSARRSQSPLVAPAPTKPASPSLQGAWQYQLQQLGASGTGTAPAGAPAKQPELVRKAVLPAGPLPVPSSPRPPGSPRDGMGGALAHGSSLTGSYQPPYVLQASPCQTSPRRAASPLHVISPRSAPLPVPVPRGVAGASPQAMAPSQPFADRTNAMHWPGTRQEETKAPFMQISPRQPQVVHSVAPQCPAGPRAGHSAEGSGVGAVSGAFCMAPWS